VAAGQGCHSGATAPSLTANVAATYSAVLTANNKSDTLNSVIVNAYTAPVADFSFDNNNTCSGTNIKFTSSLRVEL
jgi:PKD repeat protein